MPKVKLKCNIISGVFDNEVIVIGQSVDHEEPFSLFADLRLISGIDRQPDDYWQDGTLEVILLDIKDGIATIVLPQESNIGTTVHVDSCFIEEIKEA